MFFTRSCFYFQAKSDAQLAEDKAWLSAEKVWLVHKGGFAGAKVFRASSAKNHDDVDSSQGQSCKVKVDGSDVVLDVDEEDIEKVCIR